MRWLDRFKMAAFKNLTSCWSESRATLNLSQFIFPIKSWECSSSGCCIFSKKPTLFCVTNWYLIWIQVGALSQVSCVLVFCREKEMSRTDHCSKRHCKCCQISSPERSPERDLPCSHSIHKRHHYHSSKGWFFLKLQNVCLKWFTITNLHVLRE